MEATELRLGNYIRNMYGEVIKVDLKVLKEVTKGELFGVIELTEEIILNCGFVADNWAGEEESNFYYIPYDDIIFSLNNDFQPTQDGFEICNYKINYLHELQNVYRFITGQELNVKF